ncbi:alpha-1,3-mannosyl-glycoprotein 2-beta-N-acetylglucosaminyltransferase-like [Amphiura filiformis]|uniref:alpha-1,3-mannosyl-glycoprotein 2-beta-N-acetylglucosaminyltransferase-like n=1 Tax=Amphiura filiformis TaxID=82378 RepID=UPI003B215443
MRSPIRMRRQSVITWCVLLFVMWNLAAYYMFSKTAPDVEKIHTSRQLSDKLNRLQERLQDQMDINEQLIREIEEQKEQILKDKKIRTLHEEKKAKIERAQRAVDGKPALAARTFAQGEDSPYPYSSYIIPVLVIACNRAPAITRSLNTLIENRPSAEQFPIVVSQDCGDKSTAEAIAKFGDKVTHIKQPDLSSIKLPTNQKKFEGYYKIARHYKWALGQIFNEFKYDAVIIVEDDLDVSVDFFEYFLSLYPILKEDPTLWCVSAWNDNGKENRISKDADLLYRSDFFPGLGWMLLQSLWHELEPKWPEGFWDDWMRNPDQRKERSCIRPEISRTDTFGKIGVSKGQFFEQHLKYIKLNQEFVPFTKRDLSYLMKEEYDEAFRKEVYNAPEVKLSDVQKSRIPGHSPVRITYSTKENFKTFAKALGIMNDLKSGVPRAGYLGTVSFMFNNRRVYLAPPSNWKGYDPKWS